MLKTDKSKRNKNNFNYGIKLVSMQKLWDCNQKGQQPQQFGMFCKNISFVDKACGGWRH